jgi:acyl-coenzyme A thioesterase PaaI-like protein
MVTRALDPPTLDIIATMLEALSEMLEASPQRDGLAGGPGPSGSPLQGMADGLRFRPILGPDNPLGVVAESRFERDEAVTVLVLGPAIEGAPGRAHGGVVAAIFDDVTGHVLGMAGTPAFTGTLSVTYHAPTPLNVPLQFRARILRREGRRLYVGATCRAGELLVASCDATFITVDIDAFTSKGTLRP